MSTDVMAAPTTRAGRREWIGLAVLALPTLLLSLDISVLYLALPQLSSELGADSTEQLWILDIYGFMIAGFLVTMGTLGDRIGRRKLLLIGAGAFGVASVLAAYSTSPEMLIATRALLGIAGATLMPSTLALIRNMFQDPKEMGSAIGVWFSCFMGGMLLGPLVGGILLEHFWWGSAFLLGVPFMVVLLVAGPVLLPEYRDATAGRLDLASVGLSLVTILPVIYGLKEIAREGASVVAVAAVATGIAVGVAFVRRQRRLKDPLLDVRLFSNRAFSAALGVMLGTGVVMAGTSLMSTIYLQVVEGLSPLQTGLWLIPQNIIMIIGFMVAPKLARRFRITSIMTVGLAVSMVGILVHTQVGGEDGRILVVLGLVVAVGGLSLPMALTMNLLLAAAPPEKAGSAASLSETGGEFGIALGVAALGSVGTAVYRSELADTLPAGLPAPVAEVAGESVASAVAAAAHLPAAQGAELIAVASDAYSSGLNTVAVIGAVVFAALAALSFTVLRKAGVEGQEAVPEQADEAVAVESAVDRKSVV